MKLLFVTTKIPLELKKVKQIITAKQDVYKFYLKNRRDTQKTFNTVKSFQNQLAFFIEENNENTTQVCQKI